MAARYIKIDKGSGKLEYLNVDVYHISISDAGSGIWKAHFEHAFNPSKPNVTLDLTAAEKALLVGWIESGLATTAIRAAAPKIDALK